jgi:hypothetical protein
MRPADLAQAVMLTSSGTTKRLDRLESAGLIERRPDPQDRRGLLIELTPAGRRLVDDAVTDHVAAEHRLLTALTPAERDQLAGLLRKLLLGLPTDGPPAARPSEARPSEASPGAASPAAARPAAAGPAAASPGAGHGGRNERR